MQRCDIASTGSPPSRDGEGSFKLLEGSGCARATDVGTHRLLLLGCLMTSYSFQESCTNLKSKIHSYDLYVLYMYSVGSTVTPKIRYIKAQSTVRDLSVPKNN